MLRNNFRPEHPRPDNLRKLWLNLNGEWDFCFDPLNKGLQLRLFTPYASGFDKKIYVPFPWQSAFAGLTEHQPVCETAWYRCSFSFPKSMGGQQIFLRFGAVDYQASVWVNGNLVGEHEGGYLPFEFNITPQLNSGNNTLVIRVYDPLDLKEIPHGKQMSHPKDLWYECMFTPISGIWQTVWLEARPACYIKAARITPDIFQSCAWLHIESFTDHDCSAELLVRVYSPIGQLIECTSSLDHQEGHVGSIETRIEIPDPLLWDTDHPNLYTVHLRLVANGQSDDVETYFGMRSVGIQDGKILLNGKPIYLRSALDQGYWPEGIYSAPTDKALQQDIVMAKQYGLNSLRKHIKFEDPRYYYWADHLGLLIWQDTPSPATFSSKACARLEIEQVEAIYRDYNHPSIILWAPYNETWGLEYELDNNLEIQQWINKLYERIKAVDPTRLVVDNSGWEHVRTDLADIHYYIDDMAKWRWTLDTYVQRTEEAEVVLGDANLPDQVLHLPLYARGYHHGLEPFVISEYGTGLKSDRSWDMKWQTNEIRRYPEIAGYVYTEFYDIEHEFAGFLTFNRQVKQTGYDPRIVHTPDFLVLDDPELRFLIRPGETIHVNIYLSTYGQPPVEEDRLYWKVIPVTTADLSTALAISSGELAFIVEPYSVSLLKQLEFQVPADYSHVQLWAWVEDKVSSQRAINFLDYAVKTARYPRIEKNFNGSGAETLLRIDPSSFSETKGFTSHLLHDQLAEAAYGAGTGFLEYHLPFPEMDLGALQQIELTFEAASYPGELVQSVTGVPHPTSLTVFLNDIEIGDYNLYDLHLHSGGALGRLNGFGLGEHGDLIKLFSPPELIHMIAARSSSEHLLRVRFEVKQNARDRGGLILFGQNTGKFGVDPCIRLFYQNKE